MGNQGMDSGAQIFGRFLTLPEQRRLLGLVKQFSGEADRRDDAVIRLLIGSGMRIGECLAVMCADAADALVSGYLFVPRERRKGESCDLSVLLTVSVRKALRDLLLLREGAAVNEALIVSRKSAGTGKAMSVRAFELRLAYWAKLCDLPKGVSPHWLRHTHAKNIRRESEARDPNRIIQAALGHASPRSSEIYGRMDREEFEAALREVDGKVHGKPRVRMGALRKAYEGRVAA